MNQKEAKKITGGLTWTSAMPCPSYSLPASACQIGSKLAELPGTTCGICYAMRGNYRYPAVQEAQQRRLKAIEHPQWVEAMTALIYPYRWFRWHDSGDLQSLLHFRLICQVAAGTPHCKHWLPTREKRYVRGTIPKNLCTRFSLTEIDAKRPKGFRIVTSGVVRENASCPKAATGNCDTCRKCWDNDILHITYKAH